MYAQKVEGDAWAGEKLDKGKIDKMSGGVLSLLLTGCHMLTASQNSDQQLGQLYELMQAIQKKGQEGGGDESWPP